MRKGIQIVVSIALLVCGSAGAREPGGEQVKPVGPRRLFSATYGPARDRPATPEEQERARRAHEDAAREKKRIMEKYHAEMSKAKKERDQAASDMVDAYHDTGSAGSFLDTALESERLTEAQRRFKAISARLEAELAPYEEIQNRNSATRLLCTERDMRAGVEMAVRERQGLEEELRIMEEDVRRNPDVLEEEGVREKMESTRGRIEGVTHREAELRKALSENKYVSAAAPDDGSESASHGSLRAWNAALEKQHKKVGQLEDEISDMLRHADLKNPADHAKLRELLEKHEAAYNAQAELLRVGTEKVEAGEFRGEDRDVATWKEKAEQFSKNSKHPDYMRGAANHVSSQQGGDPIPRHVLGDFLDGLTGGPRAPGGDQQKPLDQMSVSDLAKMVNDKSLTPEQRKALNEEMYRRAKAATAASKAAAKKDDKKDAGEETTSTPSGPTVGETPPGEEGDEWTTEEARALMVLMWLRDEEAKAGGSDHVESGPNRDPRLERLAGDKDDEILRDANRALQDATNVGEADRKKAERLRDAAGQDAQDTADEATAKAVEAQREDSGGHIVASGIETSFVRGVRGFGTGLGKGAADKVNRDLYGKDRDRDGDGDKADKDDEDEDEDEDKGTSTLAGTKKKSSSDKDDDKDKSYKKTSAKKSSGKKKKKSGKKHKGHTHNAQGQDVY